MPPDPSPVYRKWYFVAKIVIDSFQFWNFWMGRAISTIIKFLPCISNLWSSLCNHFLKSVPSIHAFFWDWYLQGRLWMCLEHLGLADFLIENIRIFSPRALDTAIPVSLALLCFPSEQRWPWKGKDFYGSAF